MRISGPAPNLAASTEARRPDADEAFAELFARTLLREVQRAMPDGSFLGGDLEMFGDLLLDELAATLARQGDFAPGRPAGIHRTAAPRQRGVFPVDGRITSGFGQRRDPFHGEVRHHAGLDIAAPRGAPVRAVDEGVVVAAGERGGHGRTVVVRHPDGTETLYAHCDTLRVAVGDRVQAGQDIATVGSTGRSTGPHLHLEVRVDGRSVDPAARFGWRR